VVGGMSGGDREVDLDGVVVWGGWHGRGINGGVGRGGDRATITKSIETWFRGLATPESEPWLYGP
jgi:hypothetical protein